MDKTLVIAPKGGGPRLRAIGAGDLEDLRAWKNANTAAFFFKQEITPEMQRQWFDGYRARPDDHMFVVESGGKKSGVMGFRLEAGGRADAYNMIAAPAAKGKGIMKAAMVLMCSYIAARHTKNIGCLVVLGNPAVKYYEHCGYRRVKDEKDHHVLVLDWTRFVPVGFEVTEAA